MRVCDVLQNIQLTEKGRLTRRVTTLVVVICFYFEKYSSINSITSYIILCTLYTARAVPIYSVRVMRVYSAMNRKYTILFF